MTDIWGTIHTERAALADDLAALTQQQWDTASLCDQWTVRQLLAHMSSTAAMTPGAFLKGMFSNGFRFDKFAAHGVAGALGASPADTLRLFRDRIGNTTAPPGPTPSWLGETIVHAQDIRQPLGLHREYPTEAVVTLLNFYRNSNALIGSKSRIAGVTLHATDATFTHGTGPEVTGTALDLLMAMTGRRAHLDNLSGPGVAVLRGSK